MIGRQEFFAKARKDGPGGLTTEQLYSAYETYLTCPASPFRAESVMPAGCLRCGNCCRRPWRVEAQLQDVLRWARERRVDILEALELRPRPGGAWRDGDPAIIGQLAAGLAGADEGLLAMALTAVYNAMEREGCYVLPKNGGCRFLIDDVVTACAIYDTRPETCRLFPEIR